MRGLNSDTRRTNKRQALARYERFAREYIANGFNGTKAALHAGYSKKSARSQATYLLAHPAVQRILGKLREGLTDRDAVESPRIIEEMRRLGLSDPRKLFDPATGELLAPHMWPDEAASAVAGFVVTTQAAGRGKVLNVVKVRLWDKGRVLELLGKHLGLLRDRMELTGKDGEPLVPPAALTYKSPALLLQDIIELAAKAGVSFQAVGAVKVQPALASSGDHDASGSKARDRPE